MFKYLITKVNSRHFDSLKSGDEGVEIDRSFLSAKHSIMVQMPMHYATLLSLLDYKVPRSMCRSNTQVIEIRLLKFRKITDLHIDVFTKRKKILLYSKSMFVIYYCMLITRKKIFYSKHFYMTCFCISVST